MLTIGVHLSDLTVDGKIQEAYQGDSRYPIGQRLPISYRQKDFMMTIHATFIPKKHGTLANENTFKWKYGTSKKTAEFSNFYQGEFIGEPYWAISAGTGTFEGEDFFTFNMTLPHKGDDMLKDVYTLSNGLTFVHGHWIPAPPGFDGYRTVDADSATLNIIKYDPVTDIAEGTFEALFKSHGYRLNPKGTFTLKRLRAAEKPSKKSGRTSHGVDVV